MSAPGQLQVRQGSWDPAAKVGSVVHGEIRWGEWHDVNSPGWLVGFILPNSGLVYEYRNAPAVEGEQ